ncbi:MAG: hypothetical protein ACI9LV_000742 [Candidatus Nanohaloarchaea archaeon]|jgi:hypothetical protein
MGIDLKSAGMSLANYSAMVLGAAFFLALFAMIAQVEILSIGGLPLTGWIGYFLGPIAYFVYRRRKSANIPDYDRQVELIGLFGSLILSPALGIILGLILYLIGRFG